MTASAGAASATLEPKDFAVPVDSRYSFAAKVRVNGKTDLVQMRFKVLNPSGKLMIQRTIIQSDVTTGQASAVFERELADLGLEAGAYPVQLEVRVAQGNQVSEAVLDSELLLFDRKGQRIPLVFAVRVSGQPLADPSGRFVADPARYTRARDDAQELAEWVLDDDDVRVTVAISPLLLEEWRRISEGYVLTGPEGDVSVAATEPVPAAYDAALDTIQRATNTGRFELTHLGFADPNLADLSQQTLTRDIRPQYAFGRSALFAAIGATPSTGTVVAGGCIPPETIGALAGEGVAYGIVDASCTRSGQATATPGVYRVKNADLSSWSPTRPPDEHSRRQDRRRRTNRLRASSRGALLPRRHQGGCRTRRAERDRPARGGGLAARTEVDAHGARTRGRGTPHTKDGDAEDRPRRDAGARRLLGRRAHRSRLGPSTHGGLRRRQACGGDRTARLADSPVLCVGRTRR